MLRWVKDLDRILRGEATSPDSLRSGTITIPVGGLTLVLIVLGLGYGLCMGSFALFNHPEPALEQLAATTIKVPALFVLTLIVTLPSLYVFNALVGSRLSVLSMLRLLLAALAVLLAVLASFGPIVVFFSATTPSYPFIALLNVLVFAVSGVLGLVFLLQTLHRLSIDWKGISLASTEAAANPTQPASALDRLDGHVLGRHVKTVFRCWVVAFAVVGAQMGWVLRPFIGDPSMPFTWFRARQSNFFEAVWRALLDMFAVGSS